MEKSIIYESKKNAKSLWNNYRIFEDRLELEWMFGNLIIPFENIENAEIRESDLSGLLHGHLNLKNFRPALKLDLANFVEHIKIDKSDGSVHRILFTPDDIHGFMESFNNALINFRGNK